MKRNLAFVLLTLVTIGVGAILVRQSRDSEVSLRAVGEIAGEVMQDADRVGQRLVKVSTAEEARIGERLARMVVSGMPLAGGRQQDYVNAVGDFVARFAKRRDVSYRFVVLEDKWEENAFALPGGHIFITTALLALMQSEAELAGVLGHEVSHVDRRHCIERLQYGMAARKLGGDLAEMAAERGYEVYLLAYSEQKERAADEGGLEMAILARYDPRETVRLMERMRVKFGEREPSRARSPRHEAEQVIRGTIEEYFNTHPPFRQRISDMTRTMRGLASTNAQGRWYVGRVNHQSTVARSMQEMPGEWVVWKP